MIMEIEKDNLPGHIAIIMDGNGRWAKERNLDRTQGHLEGAKRVEEIIDSANNLGIKVLTLFAFSTENWNRPKAEVSLIMNRMAYFLDKKLVKIKNKNGRVQFIGRREPLPNIVLNAMDRSVKETKDNTGLIVNFAFNYGARMEIIDAVRKVAKNFGEGKIKLSEISEEMIGQSLYTHNLPDPDLLIRTSGEQRISNFLLWQLSYSELYFTKTYWPDFDEEEFKKAILDYQKRSRRYGHV